MTDEQTQAIIERLDFLRRQNNLILQALDQVGVCSVVWDDETGDAVGLNIAVRAPTITSGVSQT